MVYCQSHFEDRGDGERAAKGKRAWRLSMLFALKMLSLFVVLPVRLQCLSARLEGDRKSEQARHHIKQTQDRALMPQSMIEYHVATRWLQRHKITSMRGSVHALIE